MIEDTRLEELAAEANGRIFATYPGKHISHFGDFLLNNGVDLDGIARAYKLQGYDVFSAFVPLRTINKSGFKNYGDGFPHPMVCKALHNAGYNPEDIIRAVWDNNTYSTIERPLELGRQVLDYLNFDEDTQREIFSNLNLS